MSVIIAKEGLSFAKRHKKALTVLGIVGSLGIGYLIYRLVRSSSSISENFGLEPIEMPSLPELPKISIPKIDISSITKKFDLLKNMKVPGISLGSITKESPLKILQNSATIKTVQKAAEKIKIPKLW